jgi:hypothetical protein
VPVGEDQIPMIEQTNEIVRRFNRIAGRDILVECKALVPEIGRLPGIDGKAKMSKSLGNTINLGATAAEITAAVKKVYTDPLHLRVEDPGHLEGNVAFIYLDVFDPEKAGLAEMKAHYVRGGLGDSIVKKRLEAILQELLAPIRARREVLAGAMWGMVFIVPELLPGFSPVELAVGRYTAYGAIPRFDAARLAPPAAPPAPARLCRAAAPGPERQPRVLHAAGPRREAGRRGADLAHHRPDPGRGHFIGPARPWRGAAQTPGAAAARGRRGRSPASISTPSAMRKASGAPLSSHRARPGLRGRALPAGPGMRSTMRATSSAIPSSAAASGPRCTAWPAAWSRCRSARLAMLWAHAGGAAVGAPGRDWLLFWFYNGMLALGASVIGNHLWNIASRRLPVTLTGQLILFETVFALLYGFVYRGARRRACWRSPPSRCWSPA